MSEFMKEMFGNSDGKQLDEARKPKAKLVNVSKLTNKEVGELIEKVLDYNKLANQAAFDFYSKIAKEALDKMDPRSAMTANLKFDDMKTQELIKDFWKVYMSGDSSILDATIWFANASYSDYLQVQTKVLNDIMKRTK